MNDWNVFYAVGLQLHEHVALQIISYVEILFGSFLRFVQNQSNVS